MTYKDRENFVGYSTKLGFLDKGGKWRKRDWYLRPTSQIGDQKALFDQEIKRI
jgi:hypothetical protein